MADFPIAGSKSRWCASTGIPAKGKRRGEYIAITRAAAELVLEWFTTRVTPKINESRLRH